MITTGAWAAAWPQFRRSFGNIADFMVVTEPIPELVAGIGWTTHAAIIDAHELLYYLRRTEDGRIAIGGGAMGAVRGGRIGGDLGGHRAQTSPRMAAVAAHGLTWLFPQLEGVRFEAAWSGPMDMAPPGVPFFESSPRGTVHAGLGFSGHGLTPTKLGGKTLASLVLGEDDEWSRLPVVGPPLTKVPPEPFRRPLVQAVAWAFESGARACEQGRRRGLVRTAVQRAFDLYASRAERQV